MDSPSLNSSVKILIKAAFLLCHLCSLGGMFVIRAISLKAITVSYILILSRMEIKLENIHARDTPHKINPKEQFGPESSRLQSAVSMPSHTIQGRIRKKKVLEIDMSIWASYTKS